MALRRPTVTAQPVRWYWPQTAISTERRATDGSTRERAQNRPGTPYGAGTLYRIKIGATADHADEDSYEVLHRSTWAAKAEA